jgi:hypothetical protein
VSYRIGLIIIGTNSDPIAPMAMQPNGKFENIKFCGNSAVIIQSCTVQGYLIFIVNCLSFTDHGYTAPPGYGPGNLFGCNY